MTQSLAVVAYPTFDDADRDWLESFREVHHPQAQLAAHFTLVFPTDVALADVTAELTEAAAFTRGFPVALRSAPAVRNPLGRAAMCSSSLRRVPRRLLNSMNGFTEVPSGRRCGSTFRTVPTSLWRRVLSGSGARVLRPV